MTYYQAIRYLESFINYEKIVSYPYKESLKLARVKKFLKTIGSPQDSLKCIHVAGTKGKGSTSAFIAYILREAGYKVGLYTSPHLSDFRERIRVLSQKKNNDFEGMIPKVALADLVKTLKPAIEEYNKQSKYGALSFFEVYTALAFLYFKEAKTDFAILETGLGGRLDATNVVNPLVCVITPISYEHTEKLGNTLAEIAAEKAGIIKGHRSGVTGHRLVVVTAPQEQEVLAVIKDKCRVKGAQLYEVGKDIIVHRSQKIRLQCHCEDPPRRGRSNLFFEITSRYNKYRNLQIKLIGRHQLVNAAVSVAAVEALKKYGIEIQADCIRKGLNNTLWPGRCEIISADPLVVLDGAQNSASAKVLKEAVKENFRYRKLILVLGVSNDKDIMGICFQLCPLADTIILTQADNPRAADVEYIEDIIKSKVTLRLRSGQASHTSHVVKTKTVKQAKSYAYRLATKQDLILVTGSLFVVGEFRNVKR